MGFLHPGDPANPAAPLRVTEDAQRLLPPGVQRFVQLKPEVARYTTSPDPAHGSVLYQNAVAGMEHFSNTADTLIPASPPDQVAPSAEPALDAVQPTEVASQKTIGTSSDATSGEESPSKESAQPDVSSERATGDGDESASSPMAQTDPVRWVKDAHGNAEAAAYEAGAAGNVPGKAPQLTATDDTGTVTAKFDGVDGHVMVDRKLSITTFPKSERQMLRQSATAAENGYGVRWEVPNQRHAARAQKMADSLGVKNVDVKVKP
jgi:hypothetical protein